MQPFDTTNLKLCAYVGKETLDNEYKEFCCRKINSYFSNEELIRIFNDTTYNIDKDTFNKMIQYNLNDYIKSYLPKYIGSYSCSHIDGYLHFGISDHGIVEGIPFFSNSKMFISKFTIHRYIRNALKHIAIQPDSQFNLQFKSKHIIDWYTTNIRFSVSLLDIDPCLLDNSQIERLQLMLDTYNSVKLEWDTYSAEYKEWFSKISLYSCKLRLIFNNIETRKELRAFTLQYILDYHIDTSLCVDAIKFINSDTLIDYEITGEMVVAINNDINHFITWLILFKFAKSDELKAMKPKQPISILSNMNYQNFCQHIPNIRMYLLTQQCNFFKLSIYIPKYPIYCPLMYLSSKAVWVCRKRKTTKHGPYSEIHVIK